MTLNTHRPSDSDTSCIGTLIVPIRAGDGVVVRGVTKPTHNITYNLTMHRHIHTSPSGCQPVYTYVEANIQRGLNHYIEVTGSDVTSGARNSVT